MNESTYTLAQLAEAFGLTPRTARHYVEKVLPAHHRRGRGRKARYGQDTWNCFAFIRKARDEQIKVTRIASVLAGLGQEQIDNVAAGREELSIVPTPATVAADTDTPPREAGASIQSSAAQAETESPGRPPSDIDGSGQRPAPRWQVLYSDDTLQITHHGEASMEQRDQVRLAAELIKGILNP
jgi:DNA-binding transcriptional MerR regulator